MKRKTWPGKRRISLLLVLIFIVASTSVLQPVHAASLSSSYLILKNDPVNQQFIQRLNTNGATEAQIESFLTDLDDQVRDSGSLNEANFNSIMYNALKELLDWTKHEAIFMALMLGFGEEIDYILQYNQLHPNLVPLRNAVKDAVLGSAQNPDDNNNNPTPGDNNPGSNTGSDPSTNPPTGDNNGSNPNTGTQPNGGGTPAAQNPDPNTDAVSTEISQQLARQDGSPIQLPLNTAGNISISAASLQQIISVGREIQISNQYLNLRIPAGAITAGNANISISVTPLTEANAAAALQKRSTDQKLVGSVYEFNSSSDASISGLQFQKPLSVSLSYAGTSLAGIATDKLDVHYYNESQARWERMNGIQNRNAQTITFNTAHFSKYAIMTVATGQTNQNPVKQEDLTKPTTVTPVTNPSPNQPVVTNGSVFVDLQGHWASQDIEKMVKLGLVSGMSPGIFAPDRKITRAEFAALLVKALKIQPGTIVSSRFTDITTDKWYFGVVNAAAQAGLVNGISSNSYGPDQAITREQMAVMIAKALDYQKKVETINPSTVNSTLAVFNDQNSISSWARDGAARVVQTGIVKGRGNGYFAPAAHATRAEGSVMILKMFNQR